jgi:hypothetical protein
LLTTGADFDFEEHLLFRSTGSSIAICKLATRLWTTCEYRSFHYCYGQRDMSFLNVDLTELWNRHGKIPNLVRDPYWGTTEVQLPYTEAAMNAKRDEECADLGSTVDYE